MNREKELDVYVLAEFAAPLEEGPLAVAKHGVAKFPLLRTRIEAHDLAQTVAGSAVSGESVAQMTKNDESLRPAKHKKTRL